MSFNYVNVPTTASRMPTYESKVVLAKSFLININGGSPAESAVPYVVGYLPKEAQVIQFQAVGITAVSGGGISASTLTVTVNGSNLISSFNTFATGQSNSPSVGYMSGFFTNPPATDQPIAYTFTHTGGTTPTAGRVYVTITYAV